MTAYDGLACAHCNMVFPFDDHVEETFAVFSRHHDLIHPDCDFDNNVTIIELVGADAIEFSDLELPGAIDHVH